MIKKDWIVGADGYNQKYRHETLLNYGMNRWGLNRASKVGPTSELIRRCTPKVFKEWESFYFKNAKQKKVNGQRITKEYMDDLGRRLYIKLSEVVQNELESIQEEECINYVFNLVLNRTYEGYKSEIDTIYGQLESHLNKRIHPAPDKWDRKYNVDFYIQVKSDYIGLQIKPISSGRALDYYQWEKMHESNHRKFEKEQGGKVFFIYSITSGKKKIIQNQEVIEEIEKEINKLNI